MLPVTAENPRKVDLKETAKKKENKKEEDPKALKADKIEEKNLQENLEKVKNKLSPVISRSRPMFIIWFSLSNSFGLICNKF